MSATIRRTRASVALIEAPRCLMVADAGTEKGTCYARCMSRPTRPVFELPTVPDEHTDTSVDALALELALEPVTLESPLEYDEQVEYCVDCDDEAKGAQCEECLGPLCDACDEEYSHLCSGCGIRQ